ncbi:unnamed protein product, partial [Rotaria sp. Silwood2]
TALKTFQYSSAIPPLSLTDLNIFQIHSCLHSLTLILTNFPDIYLVIFSTPNLEYLNIQCESPYQNHNPIININIKLKQFDLKLIQKQASIPFITPIPIDFDQLFNFGLDIETEHEFPFNSIKLQELLEPMRELKKFHLYAKLKTHFCDSYNILSKFRNQYWIDHNLSFGMH